ncbi:polyphenol oxidase YfiH [Gammaproteobacteria bacterium]
MNNYIEPHWPAPKNVKAFTTKRIGGNFNLHIGNNPNNVLANRKKLYQELNLPAEPFWLKQEHTNTVIHLEPNTTIIEPIADAAFATTPNLVCVVTTADCVPILVCDQNGTIVAAIHAGWKGIATGIIEATIKAMNTNPTKLLAWLGPAIGANSFEAGEDMREIFIKSNPESQKAFVAHNDRFLTNIYLLASQCLNTVGITAIYGGKYCTFTQKELFFSFRREGISSGRMASLIWLTA